MKLLNLALQISLLAVLSGTAMAQSRTDDQRQTPPELWTNVDKQKLVIFANANRNTGNVDSTSYGGNLRYALKFDDRNALFAEGSAAYSAYAGKTQMENGRLSALFVNAIAPSWNAYLWASAGQNRFLNLHYRTTEGAGLCYHGFWSAVFKPIMVSAGVAPEYAKYYGGSDYRKFRANARIVFRIPVTSFMSIGNDFIYFASFNNFSDYRIYNETFADFPIVADKLSYRITAVDEYENDPFPGIKNNDFTLTQGLVFQFGK